MAGPGDEVLVELHHVAGMRRTSRWAWQPVGGVLGNAGAGR
ncbi:hypothetical protein ACWGK6_14020 [Streptomyces violaceusniger]